MPTRDRARDRGRRRSRRLVSVLGTELREARLAAGVSQAHVARVSGLSQSTISRTERLLRPALTIEEAAIHAEVLGLQLSVKAYPGGPAVRDAAQLRLLGRLRAQVHPDYPWRSEIPVTDGPDLRAWDAFLDGPVSVGIEAETRLHDIQATDRRTRLKLRDSGADVVILLVADTVHNRRIIREHRAALAGTFPADTAEILGSLRSGRPLARSGLVVL